MCTSYYIEILIFIFLLANEVISFNLFIGHLDFLFYAMPIQFFCKILKLGCAYLCIYLEDFLF
jgi:hypothetical protein